MSCIKVEVIFPATDFQFEVMDTASSTACKYPYVPLSFGSASPRNRTTNFSAWLVNSFWHHMAVIEFFYCQLSHRIGVKVHFTFFDLTLS